MTPSGGTGCEHKLTWDGPWPMPNNTVLTCEKCGDTLVWAAPNRSNPKGLFWLPNEDELREVLRDQKPWGHKLTVSIYVEGDSLAAEAVISRIEDPATLDLPGVGFVGIGLEVVDERPSDQVAT